MSSLGKIAEALEVSVADFFNNDLPIDINSFDISIVKKLRLLDQLEEIEKNQYITLWIWL